MGAIVCELCGSNDITKRGEFFVCEHCGTKYTPEDAKKLVVQGVVKLDNTEKLANLYEIARRAKKDGNSASAEKYYDMILVEDPMSWEASFYVVYFRAMQCKIAHISSAAASISNCLPSVLKLIHSQLRDKEEQKEAVIDVWARACYIADMLHGAAVQHFNGIGDSIREKYRDEFVRNATATFSIMYMLGDCIDKLWKNDAEIRKYAESAWKTAIDGHSRAIKSIPISDRENVKKVILAYSEKVKKYDPDYIVPSAATTSEGCYVATAVYGSYDCPEVWTLRRFRDYSLAKTLGGRIFIKVYYAISPTLVRWFGYTEWFKRMWKGKLDVMVKKLNSKGVDNTPYEDMNWNSDNKY